MSKSVFTKISVGLIVGLVLTLQLTNVEGVNLGQMRTIYGNFFDGLEGIIPGNPRAILEARATYNDCATRATSYPAIVTCAVTAFNAYNPSLRNVLRTNAQNIINVFNSFYNALQPVEVPETQRGIMIPALHQLVHEAAQLIETAPERAAGA